MNPPIKLPQLDNLVAMVNSLVEYDAVVRDLSWVDPNQEFDGRDLLTIYLRRIGGLFGGVTVVPALVALEGLHTDPLLTTVADTFVLTRIGEDIDQVLIDTYAILRAGFLERSITQETDESRLSYWLQVDRKLNQHIRKYMNRRAFLGQNDEWLHTKLKEQTTRADRQHDFFNVWTTSDSNRAIPRDVLERCVDPSLPPFKKEDV
ncbi:hypothetical protein D3C87_1272770 [compost metagenome]